MIRSLQQDVVDPTYLEFFGLKRPPFARLDDPSELYHTEQYSLLIEHLDNASAQADTLVVVCGADGSGKSTLLDLYACGIGEHISYVVIDETCKDEIQFYVDFLTQIGFIDISGTLKELRNITKQFLVCRGIAGDHLLILFDNAHMTDPRILKELQWLCQVKIKDQRVLSVVLTGNASLIRVVDAPAMRNVRFQSHVVFGIRAYTEEETANYVWHRLRLAGGEAGVKLPPKTYAHIHRYSGGIPRLINDLCHGALAEAHALETRVVGAKIVRHVADKYQLLPHVVPLHGKGRRKTDPDSQHLQVVPDAEDAVTTGGLQPEVSPAKQSQPAPVADLGILLHQIARLTAQVENLRADKVRALHDIEDRNRDILELRDELRSQSKMAADLKRSQAVKADEIARQNLELTNNANALRDGEDKLKRFAVELENEIRARQAVERDLATVTACIADLEERLRESQKELDQAERRISDRKDPKELQRIKTTSNRRAADLRKQKRARKRAERELAKVAATVEELSQRKQELEHTVCDLQARVEVAGDRAADCEILERESVDLKVELEAKTGQLESIREEMASLRDELISRNQQLADFEIRLEESQNRCKSAELRVERLKDPRELEEVEEAAARLTTDLEQESRARQVAEDELAMANATIGELRLLKQGLQAKVHELNADLRMAGDHAVDIYALETKASDLQDKVENKTRELEQRNLVVAVLEEQLAASRKVCEILRDLTPDVSFDESTGLFMSATGSDRDAGVQDSDAAATPEQLTRKVPAYESLRKFDPEFCDELVTKYKKWSAQDLTDKQIDDALRTEQMGLLERLLPRASNLAILNYARLIVDQLDEFQLDGIEPCLRLLVPPSSPADKSSPVYSEITREREVDLLDLTLKTYNSLRPIPAGAHVWPDLEPIFAELFQAFGADNVAAMQNSYDPTVDRMLVCNVARALYSGMLNMPRGKAANALRWLLSS